MQIETTQKIIDADPNKRDSKILREQFMSNVTSLIQFMSDINEKLQKVSDNGAYPVEPGLFSLGKIALSSLSPEVQSKIMNEYAARAIPHFQSIQDHNVGHFTSIAESLFPELPSGIIKQAIVVLNHPKMTPDKTKAIFSFIIALLKLTMRRQCVLVRDKILCCSDLASDFEATAVALKLIT